MKFKPYMIKSTTNISNVLISKTEDVPKVSIIVPTRDGFGLLKKCYDAINKNTCYPNWELIIGDSESSDETVRYFSELLDERVKFIKRGTTEGSFSSINNELVAQATGEYLLFLNNDTEPQKFWLFEMMSKIHRDSNVGIVGAKLLYPHNKIQHAGIAFTQQGPVNLGESVLRSFPKNFADYDRSYQAVTAACLLIRAKDFDAVEGFDPIYYFCYEDVDLCLKVRERLKKQVVYASRSNVIHSESVTQRKHKTSGVLQQNGISVFKDRWLKKVNMDFSKLQKGNDLGKKKIDISFITCVNNVDQYRDCVLGSLFKNKTDRLYETIPILNFGNTYSASQALNIGLDQAKSDIIVFCHQDVLFYENWIDLLYERINEVEKRTKKWGVLGTAGINNNNDTIGVVHSIKGAIQWESNKRVKTYPVQTVDEHCMIIRKSSGLRFDEKTFDGWHFYGADLCLSASKDNMINFGILNPLVHDSASGSLDSGEKEFMRLLNVLADKWRTKYPIIRTTTSLINRSSIRTFIKFKK